MSQPPPSEPDLEALAKLIGTARDKINTQLRDVREEKRALLDMLDDIEAREQALLEQAGKLGIVVDTDQRQLPRNRKLEHAITALRTKPALAGMSANQIAKHLNVSGATVEKARRVLRETSKETN